MRKPVPAPSLAAALLVAASAALPARAQDEGAGGAPLFLRIRSVAAALPPGEAEALAARARREAVWARSDARAHLAIASVCTGCLAPTPPEPGPVLVHAASAARATEADPAGAGPALPLADSR